MNVLSKRVQCSCSLTWMWALEMVRLFFDAGNRWRNRNLRPDSRRKWRWKRFEIWSKKRILKQGWQKIQYFYSARLIFNIPTSFHSDFTTQKWRFLKKGPFRSCISTYAVKVRKIDQLCCLGRNRLNLHQMG